MFKLIPSEEKYFTLLAAMATKVKEGGSLFVQMFQDYENRVKYAEQIKTVELTCDELGAEIRQKLNSSFITPFDREDIFLLAQELDDVIDMINAVARNFDVYDVNALKPGAVEMAKLLGQATSEVSQAVALLEKRTGMETHLRAISDIEKRGDTVYLEATRSLFREEKDPICVIKWQAIYGDLENSLDRCKDLAEALESVIVKNK